jgi:hypothetical protein
LDAVVELNWDPIDLYPASPAAAAITPLLFIVI